MDALKSVNAARVFENSSPSAQNLAQIVRDSTPAPRNANPSFVGAGEAAGNVVGNAVGPAKEITCSSGESC